MIDVTYSGWVAIFTLLQLGGFATLFYFVTKAHDKQRQEIKALLEELLKKIVESKDQAMVDARAIAGLINNKKP